MDFKSCAGPIALLLFSVALLLCVCLCIMCKRKKRRTQDVGRILQGVAAMESRLQLTRNRSDSNACPGGECALASDPESGSSRNTEVTGDAARLSAGAAGQTNAAFVPDASGLPPEYEEALKSKYLKVYQPIYPSLSTTNEQSSSAGSASSSAGRREDSDIRSVSGESPPPPYDTCVSRNNIDALGYFS
ncbi:uncharacterized protein LOC129602751 isoform X2 [Paramacrobiotus metropolitanus]|uniref:uncharacterized protein LOC129602751 isoform X2 n=1 Tax=Paramacrobiotus metropolitanus TaxID=2943436 RepID=UPI0024456B8E|nr:uncharacterized protein LOC129602751 isoform X2 [Paramacrobiotus metropolitanus]